MPGVCWHTAPSLEPQRGHAGGELLLALSLARRKEEWAGQEEGRGPVWEERGVLRRQVWPQSGGREPRKGGSLHSRLGVWTPGTHTVWALTLCVLARG